MDHTFACTSIPARPIRTKNKALYTLNSIEALDSHMVKEKSTPTRKVEVRNDQELGGDDWEEEEREGGGDKECSALTI